MSPRSFLTRALTRATGGRAIPGAWRLPDSKPESAGVSGGRFVLSGRRVCPPTGPVVRGRAPGGCLLSYGEGAVNARPLSREVWV